MRFVPSSDNRREFFTRAALSVTACFAGLRPLGAAEEAMSSDNALTFGLVADVHFADTDSKGSRYYRDSAAKLAEAVETFREKKAAFLVELGDLVNAGPSKEAELGYLKSVRAILDPFPAPKHFVLGNHCVDTLTKEEFLAGCGADPTRTWYSFDQGGWHFVVLDADFLEDGTSYAAGNFQWTDSWIPDAELRWLQADLKRAAGRPTVVFVHQNLHNDGNLHAVKNAPEVRKVLEAAGNVAAVFQGHMHTGGYAVIGQIAYITLRALVEGPGLENNSFALVTLGTQGIEVRGFGKMPSRTIPLAAPATAADR